MKKKTITMLREEFENEQTGEKVEGITIIVDGMFKDFLDVIKVKKPQYGDNLSLIQDALVQGLEVIRKSIQ